MKIIKFIPNLFTLGNLALGLIGIALLLTGQGEITTVSYCIIVAAALDFCDGFLAKALKAQSEIGAQLDSLADLVTFGVLPGFIYWHLTESVNWNEIVILVPLCSAYRLAKFNVDTEQTDYFKGISTTAHGLFVATIPWIINTPDSLFSEILNTEVYLIVFALMFSWLMISNLHMISFKFKDLSWKNNWHRYVMIIGSLVAIPIWSWSASICLLILYLILSLDYHYRST
jgi:CDP-diacylglycerol--serine O-phosphatidyltransferase